MEILSKIRQDPLGALRRGLYKGVLGRVKYGRSDGYDASRYWGDRLGRYGTALKGVGDEGLSEEANAKAYAEAGEIFRAFVRDQGIDVAAARVLEIGCGSGFYTRILGDLGARTLTALDITDALFPELRAEFPEYTFVRADITEAASLGERYDIVVMIDVIQHIVLPEKLSAAVANIQSHLAEGGTVFLAPAGKESKKRLFYVAQWSRVDLTRRFDNCTLAGSAAFRSGDLLALRGAGG